TRDARVLALDAKLNFDDNALYRHKEIVALRDTNEEDPLDVEASKYSLNYIKLDGNVGCMVNGAGLAMATMDIIKLAGGEPANFLDVGGGASPEQIENAFRILSSDPSVKAVFIKVFGGVPPSKGGTTHEGFPVWNTVAEAVANEGELRAHFRPAACGGRRDHGSGGGGHSLDRLHHRGDPGRRHGPREALPRRDAEPADRPELPRCHHAGRGEDRHHARPHPHARPRRRRV